MVIVILKTILSYNFYLLLNNKMKQEYILNVSFAGSDVFSFGKVLLFLI